MTPINTDRETRVLKPRMTDSTDNGNWKPQMVTDRHGWGDDKKPVLRRGGPNPGDFQRSVSYLVYICVHLRIVVSRAVDTIQRWDCPTAC